ncbi:MAG: transporter substrate-binding domain-containing protein [Massilia sp.]
MASAAAAFLLLGLAQAAPRTVTVMAQETITPRWIFDGPRPQGVCPDILEALENIEPRLRFSGYNSGRSLPAIEAALETGKAGAACALLDSPRRRDVGRIVGPPLYTVRHRLAALASDTAEINSMDDLARLKPLINTARGSAYIVEFKQRGIPVDDDTGDNRVNLRKILAGHGRYTYMNELTLQRYIRSEHLEKKIKMLPVVLREDPVYFFVSRKNDPQLIDMLDAALHRLKASGELARIYERWAK